jgi:opacity protein-like surface antigen
MKTSTSFPRIAVAAAALFAFPAVLAAQSADAPIRPSPAYARHSAFAPVSDADATYPSLDAPHTAVRPVAAPVAAPAPAPAPRPAPAAQTYEDPYSAASAAAERYAKNTRTSSPSSSGSGWDGFYDNFIARRLEIGWRAAIPRLDKDHRWNAQKGEGFLGTMADFDLIDHVYFTNFILQYNILSFLGLSLTWDQVGVVAVTQTDDRHKDGEWKEHGPTLTAVLSTPRLFDHLQAYAEIGPHFSFATFDDYTWWGKGWASPADWAYWGSPSTSNKGYTRHIDAKADSPVTLAWGFGLKLFLTENFVVDAAYRHIDADIDAHFTTRIKGHLQHEQGRYTVPLSYSEFCVGLRWAF